MQMLMLIEAGRIKEDDDITGLLQGVSRKQGEGIADWLAIATGGPVKLRHTSFDGTFDIYRTGVDDPNIGFSRVTTRSIT